MYDSMFELGMFLCSILVKSSLNLDLFFTLKFGEDQK